MNTNIYYYKFYTLRWFRELILFLELWKEEPDGSRSWAGQEVASIAEGFRIIDDLKEHSIVKKML